MKMKSFYISNILKFASILLMLLFALTPTVMAARDISYDGYNYDAYGVSTPAPEGYEPFLKIQGENLQCGAFNGPEDIFFSEDDLIYVADTKNNRIVVLSSDFEFLNTIDEIVINGEIEILEMIRNNQILPLGSAENDNKKKFAYIVFNHIPLKVL